MTDADQLRAAGGVEYSLDGVSDEEVAALSAALFEAGVRHAVGPSAVVVHPDDEDAADAALDVIYGSDPATSDGGRGQVSAAAEQRLAVAEMQATGGPVYDLDGYSPDEVDALVERLGEHRVRYAVGPDAELAVHRNDEQRAEAVLDELFGPDARDPALLTLLDVVEAYADFGDHRTGSAADLDTAAWLTEHLDALGADVEPRQVVFDRYDVRATLTGGDGPIDCIPVFYEALGAIVTGDLEVLHASAAGVGSATGLDEHLQAAPGGPARVMVLDGPPGWPVAPNRPVARPDRVPAVVVAADAAPSLPGAELDFDAQLVPGVAPIVTGELGPPGGAPVTVTTPLSGWFTCAGERATGLAVALDLATHLAERGRRVRFVAASGHELDHLGTRVWLDEIGHAGGPVVHLGASVAACEATDGGSLALAPTRYVLSSVAVPDLAEAVAPAALTVIDTDPWPGEGRDWLAAGAPVLSVVGRFRWFHTANDVPGVATDLTALETVRTAVGHAVDRFLGVVDG